MLLYWNSVLSVLTVLGDIRELPKNWTEYRFWHQTKETKASVDPGFKLAGSDHVNEYIHLNQFDDEGGLNQFDDERGCRYLPAGGFSRNPQSSMVKPVYDLILDDGVKNTSDCPCRVELVNPEVQSLEKCIFSPIPDIKAIFRKDSVNYCWDNVYHIVLDVGSSGTRAHVLQTKSSPKGVDSVAVAKYKGGLATEVRKALDIDYSTLLIEEIGQEQVIKIKDVVNTHFNAIFVKLSEDPENPQKHFRNGRLQSVTALASAGMRFLAILQPNIVAATREAVQTFLEEKFMDIEKDKINASIMPGTDEAFYALIQTNIESGYLTYSIEATGQNSESIKGMWSLDGEGVGILEIGNLSTQLAAPKKSMDSILFGGSTPSWKACFWKGTEQNDVPLEEGDSTEFGNPEECQNKIKKSLGNKLTSKFKGQFEVHPTIYGVSNAFYTSHFFKFLWKNLEELDTKTYISSEELKRSVNRFCAEDEIRHEELLGKLFVGDDNTHKWTKKDYLKNRCLVGSILVVLLEASGVQRIDLDENYRDSVWPRGLQNSENSEEALRELLGA